MFQIHGKVSTMTKQLFFKYADPPYEINNSSNVASKVKYDFRTISILESIVKIGHAFGKYDLYHINYEQRVFM